MQFERNLFLLRKKNSLSQDELAFMIGVSRQTIYTWEAGLNYPNIIMLKKLADVLGVSTDELLNGFEVNKLPERISRLELKFVSEYDGEVLYDELPNWFISLKPESEISYGIYDLKKDELVRDYSYHLEVKNEVVVHDIDGVELEIKEYNSELAFTKKYQQYITKNKNGIAWIGEMNYQNDKKVFKTFKDQDFLDNWGVNGKLEYKKVKYDNEKIIY